MKQETRSVYVAEDGKVFDSETECSAHEEVLTKEKLRLKKIKFYSISHSPDLTEGRGLFGCTYLAIEDDYYHNHYMLDYCKKNFGDSVQFVQGACPIPGWEFREITLEQFSKWQENEYNHLYGSRPKKVGVFLSDVGDYLDFPKAISKSALYPKR